MKLQPLKNAVCFGCGESFVQSSGGVGRKIVDHDVDLVRIPTVDIGQIAHVDGKILRGSLHLPMAPGSLRIKEHAVTDSGFAAAVTQSRSSAMKLSGRGDLFD
jgi:hypothetical protein